MHSVYVRLLNLPGLRSAEESTVVYPKVAALYNNRLYFYALIRKGDACGPGGYYLRGLKSPRRCDPEACESFATCTSKVSVEWFI